MYLMFCKNARGKIHTTFARLNLIESTEKKLPRAPRLRSYHRVSSNQRETPTRSHRTILYTRTIQHMKTF